MSDGYYEFITALGERLKNRRKAAGLLQKDIARQLGMSNNSVVFYEKGGRAMNIWTFVRLCRLFDVSADELLGLEVRDGE